MSTEKQTKPFLKKGTRQFLSNAQVRSQSQKPKIVQFEDQEFNQTSQRQPIIGKKQNNPQKNRDQDIMIPVKSRKTTTETRDSYNGQEKQEESKTVLGKGHGIAIKGGPNVPLPRVEKNSQGVGRKTEKKTTMLEDYLGDEVGKQQSRGSGNKKERVSKDQKMINNYQNRNQLNTRPTNEELQRRNSNNTVQSNKKTTSMASMLYQQNHQQELSGDQQISHRLPQNRRDEQIKKTTKSKVKDQLGIKPVQECKPKINGCYDMGQSIQNNSQLVNFEERSDEDNNQVCKANSFQAQNTAFKQPSKLTQKLFGGKSSNPAQKFNSKASVLPPAKLTIQDIPKQLKSQIISTHLRQKLAQLQKGIQQVNRTRQAQEKGKTRLQEDMKKLEKQREELKKEMELRQSQLEDKLKNQKSKLDRHTKIVRDHQSSLKDDWKLKTELKQTQKQLQQQQNKRKETETKLKSEIVRLKKMLEQQISKNKILTENMKLLQQSETMQRQQPKQVACKVEKRVSPLRPTTYWENPPMSTYLSRLKDDNFHVYEFAIEQYHFQNVQYYKYYLQCKDQVSQLQSEQVQQNKIKRTYRSGKVQTQFLNRFLKQSFPFKYQIVNHVQGDIKQILPQGIVVYYDYRNNLVQYMVDKDKRVVYFVDKGLVQMEWKNRGQIIKEVFDGKKWRLEDSNGKEQIKNFQNQEVIQGNHRNKNW